MLRRDVRLVVIAAAIMQACPSYGAAPAASVLTSKSLGPVKIGMTLKQAQAALGTSLRYDPDDPGNPSCGHAKRTDKLGNGLHYMVENGHITRIEIWPADVDPESRQSTVKTAAGLGLGSSEEQIRTAYGSAVEVQPAPYNDTGHWFILNDAKKRYGILFETADGKVTTFWSGKYPSLIYREDCL